MVAGNKSLNREDLVSRKRAENVCDPQCLRIAMEDDIGPGNSAKCDERSLLVTIPVNIGSEQEATCQKLRDETATEDLDGICRISILNAGGYVVDGRILSGVHE